MPRPKKAQSPTPEFEVDLTNSFEELEKITKSINKHTRILSLIESTVIIFLAFLILWIGLLINIY